MPRVMKRTRRRLSPLARELADIQNDLDRLTRKVARLREKVASAESKASALDVYLDATAQLVSENGTAEASDGD